MWALTVDETNPSDLKKTITRLQKRRKKLLAALGYNGISFQGNRVHAGKVLPLIEHMLATDLSSIYGKAEGSRDFYVYVHCDPTVRLNVAADLRHVILASKLKLKTVPFYVGKGTGDRCFVLNRNEGHRKVRGTILARGIDIDVVKVADGLTEHEALALEAKLIDILGIRHLAREGILVNLDEGEQAQARRKLYGPDVRAILLRNGFR